MRPDSLPYSAQGRVPHRARLLIDFLEHEVLVAALFRHDGIPQNVRNLAFHGASVEVGEMHAIARQDGHVAIGQEEHVACITQDRGHVGSHEILAIA